MVASPQAPPPAKQSFVQKLNHFWARVTEGQAVDQLWRQFVTDARSSYRVYSRDVPHHEAVEVPRSKFRRFLHAAKEWFWAILMKLTPARRVVLLLGLVMLFTGEVQTPHGTIDFDLRTYGGLVILLVLVMELADRVVMKRDLEIARDIQRWLVPAAPPVIARVDIAFTTRPANTVSGDYYDVLAWPRPASAMEQPSRSSSHYLIVVADVAGKSVPAALLMATFHASFHSLAGNTDSLLELVRGVNRYVSARSGGGQRFTTAFLADLDISTNTLTCINAGHNPPILRRANGSIERLEAGGLPLGIMGDAPYEQEIKILAAGDTLVVFTDGVVEAVNPGGEEFGEGRLLNCVLPAGGSAAQLLQAIMQNVDYFVGTAPQQDDITCLIARINPEGTR